MTVSAFDLDEGQVASKALQSTLRFIGGVLSVAGLKSCESSLLGLVRSLRADRTVSVLDLDDGRVALKKLQLTFRFIGGASSVSGLKSSKPPLSSLVRSFCVEWTKSAFDLDDGCVASKSLQLTVRLIGGALSVAGLKSSKPPLSGLVRSIWAATVSALETDDERVASKALQLTSIFAGGASSVTGLKSSKPPLAGLVRSLCVGGTVSALDSEDGRVASKALQSTIRLIDGVLSVAGLKSCGSPLSCVRLR